jgi:hypothetical protein
MSLLFDDVALGTPNATVSKIREIFREKLEKMRLLGIQLDAKVAVYMLRDYSMGEPVD